MKQQNDKPKILVVDDVVENIHTIMNILRDKFAVIAATSGPQALTLAAETPRPDLILLDIKMPGMDGYEVLRRLKADAATADIPVIFTTALTDSSNEAMGLSLGAADYITKPINPDLLRVRIMAQLELQRYRRIPLSLDDQERKKTQNTILVVDDMVENVHDLISALSEEFRVVAATSGEEAINIVNSGSPPDLILLDILMPGLDGYETLRRIKATESGRRIPVFFVTVVDKTLEKIKGFSLGAADYITKPFDIEEVRARIRTHLRLNHLQTAYEHAYRALSELEEMRDNLVKMVVHDMRSPLMALCASLELLLINPASSMSADERKLLKNGLAAGQDLTNMVTSLLDVSRLEEGSMPLDIKPCFISHTLRQAVDRLAPLTRSHRLTVELPEREEATWCDQEITERIITNLVTNAIKFSPPGSTIRIVLSHKKGWSRVSVTDNGPGIPLEYQTKIFDKFAQVRQRASGKKFSSGLGLSFCKMAAEAQGGCLTLESREGEGATFTLFLPTDHR